MGRKLAKNVYVGEDFYEAGSEPPKEIAEQITNPAAWGDSIDDADPDVSYGSMKKPDLEAEVASRNADRDEDSRIQVGGNGTVKDLRAALEADDAANA